MKKNLVIAYGVEKWMEPQIKQKKKKMKNLNKE